MAATFDPTNATEDQGTTDTANQPATSDISQSDLKPPVWVMDDNPLAGSSSSVSAGDTASQSSQSSVETEALSSHPAISEEDQPVISSSQNNFSSVEPEEEPEMVLDALGNIVPQKTTTDTVQTQTTLPAASAASVFENPQTYDSQTQPWQSSSSSQPVPASGNSVEPVSQVSDYSVASPQPLPEAEASMNAPFATSGETQPIEPYAYSEPTATSPVTDAIPALPNEGVSMAEIPTQPAQDVFTPQPLLSESETTQFAPPPPPSFTPSPEANNGDTASGFVAADLHPNSSPIKKIALIVLALVTILGLAFLIIRVILPLLSSAGDDSSQGDKKSNKAVGPPVTLTYWGLWEPSQVLDSIFAKYKQEHPNVTINYVQQSNKDYRERLQAAIAGSQGPDIFRFHNTWLPMLRNDLQPDTGHLIDLSQYFPVIGSNVNLEGQVYGVPLGFDTLALYYNPELLQQANLNVPKTWDEFRTTAYKLTKKDNEKRILQAGAALGTTNNVDHFSDILGLMLLQSGGDPANPSDTLVATALEYYTNYYKKDGVWDETLPNSTYAFATGKVAMIFAPSWRAFEIGQINPDLRFATAPVPQLPGEPTAWATYWVEGVSKRSKNADEAWKLLQFMSKDENLTALYTAQGSTRMFGEPYPKKLLSDTLRNEPIVGAFVSQGDYAKSWFLASRTYDNGINDRIIKYYEDAINSILRGSTAQQVQPTLAQGVSQILGLFNVAVRTPSSTTTDTR